MKRRHWGDTLHELAEGKSGIVELLRNLDLSDEEIATYELVRFEHRTKLTREAIEHRVHANIQAQHEVRKRQ